MIHRRHRSRDLYTLGWWAKGPACASSTTSGRPTTPSASKKRSCIPNWAAVSRTCLSVHLSSQQRRQSFSLCVRCGCIGSGRNELCGAVLQSPAFDAKSPAIYTFAPATRPISSKLRNSAFAGRYTGGSQTPSRGFMLVYFFSGWCQPWQRNPGNVRCNASVCAHVNSHGITGRLTDLLQTRSSIFHWSLEPGCSSAAQLDTFSTSLRGSCR